MSEHRHDPGDAPAALENLLDGLSPLAQRPETEAFIAGARTAADLLAQHDAEAGDR